MQLCRWPPHINLLYPFYEDTGNAFRECTEAAAQALSTLQPFEVGLAQFILSEPKSVHIFTGDLSACLAL